MYSSDGLINQLVIGGTHLVQLIVLPCFSKAEHNLLNFCLSKSCLAVLLSNLYHRLRVGFIIKLYQVVSCYIHFYPHFWLAKNPQKTETFLSLDFPVNINIFGANLPNPRIDRVPGHPRYLGGQLAQFLENSTGTRLPRFTCDRLEQS